MRIFMLVQTPGARGPVPKHTSHLVAALRSLGCTVVTHPWGQRRAGESLVLKLIQRVSDVLSARSALKDREFDIAVVKSSHGWLTLLRDIPVVLMIRRRCRPIVLQLHGSRASLLVERGSCVSTVARRTPFPRTFKLVTRVLLALVDGIMVLSTEEERQFQTFYPGLPVFTVKNPYISVFPSGPPPRSTALPPRPRVLFVGRIIKEKGIFELLEAFAEVVKRARCDLVIVGEGDQERRVCDRIEDLGLENCVSMVGYLSGSTLIDKYNDSTVLVLPSWSEGFPTVLAEAMDAGLPIVTTRIRGAADHLIPDENALFVEPRDINGLASALLKVLTDEALRGRMSSANRKRIQIFAPKIVAVEYFQALQSLVQGRGTLEESQPENLSAKRIN
jgi:glycosyltransferase involved in cell wall biosynthesis